jgi:hypothetical protein
MKISFILWNTEESDTVKDAITKNNYTVVYDYITINSDEHKRVSSLFITLKSMNALSQSQTVTEVPWMDTQL